MRKQQKLRIISQYAIKPYPSSHSIAPWLQSDYHWWCSHWHLVPMSWLMDSMWLPRQKGNCTITTWTLTRHTSIHGYCLGIKVVLIQVLLAATSVSSMSINSHHIAIAYHTQQSDYRRKLAVYESELRM